MNAHILSFLSKRQLSIVDCFIFFLSKQFDCLEETFLDIKYQKNEHFQYLMNLFRDISIMNTEINL